MKKGSLIKLLGLTAIVSMVACSVSDKTLTAGQNRIDALKAQGMPDSLLSPAKLLIRQATDEKTRNPSIANKAADSLKKVLTQLELSFKSTIPQLQSEIESMRAQITQTRSQVTGMQVAKIDSMMRIADSLNNLKWYPDAAAKMRSVVAALPQLQQDEQKAAEIKGKVAGTWTCTNVTKHSEDPTVNAVEKKIFILNRDGTCKFIEQKQGKSGPFLKEDYQYISYGTYGFLGDTVYLSINRFQAVRQNFEHLFIDGKKRTWKKEPHPSYDTTLTDKSQDRFVAYPDLVSDFVHTN
jgi:hypothetical protein